MSAAHTWFGRSIRRLRSRYGNIRCPGPGMLVRGFGPRAAMPMRRISRCTRLRLTAAPSPCSILAIRRDPRKGRAVNSSSSRRISAKSLSFAATGRYTPERASPSSWHCRRIDTERSERSSMALRSGTLIFRTSWLKNHARRSADRSSHVASRPPGPALPIAGERATNRRLAPPRWVARSSSRHNKVTQGCLEPRRQTSSYPLALTAKSAPRCSVGDGSIASPGDPPCCGSSVSR